MKTSPFATPPGAPAEGAPEGSPESTLGDDAIPTHTPDAGNGSGAAEETLAPPPVAATKGDDRYELLKELARGGMGRVMVAFDRRIGREVAIKEMLRSEDQLTVARFWRESLMTARLQHPGIVPVYEIGERSTGEPFLTMRRVEGRPLEAFIHDAKLPEQRLRLLPNVLAAIDAVAYAHERHVIHRDLKPANILVGEFGETVLIDWGLAKEVDPAKAQAEADADVDAEASTFDSPDARSGLTLRGAVIGTPTHMPPEQAAGLSTDPRSDVYSLGAILYHLLTGSPPFRGSSSKQVLLKVLTQTPTPVEQLAPWAPPDLVSIVKRAMSRERDARFGSARELGAELRGFLSGQLVASHQYTWRQRTGRFIKRNAAAVLVSSVALLLLGLIGALSVQRIIEEREVATAERKVATEERDVAEERQQQLAIQRARLLMETDPLAALEAIEALSPAQPGWGDARLLAEEIRDRGLPRWRLPLPHSATVLANGSEGIWVGDGPGRIWSVDPHSGQLDKLPDSVRGELAASSDDSSLIATDEDGVLRVYDGASAQAIGAPSRAHITTGLGGGASLFRSVRLLRGPRLLGSLHTGGILRIDPQAGTDVALLPEAGEESEIVASEDGEVIVYEPAAHAASESAPSLSWIWDAKKGKRQLDATGDWDALALSPDGSIVAWVDKKGHAGFDSSRIKLGDSLLTHARAVSFDARGSWLAVVGGDGLELIDLVHPENAHRLVPLADGVSARFDAAGARLAVVQSGAVSVVDLATGAVEWTVHRPGVTSAWLLKGGLVTATPDELLGWSRPSPPRTFELGGDKLYSFFVIPPGDRWAAVTNTGPNAAPELQIWSGTEGASQPLTGVRYLDPFISPSGDTLAWQSDDKLHIESRPGEPSRIRSLAKGRALRSVSDGEGFYLLSAAGEFVLAPGSDEERPVRVPSGVAARMIAPCGSLRFLGLFSDDKVRSVDASTGTTTELAGWPAGGVARCAPDSSEFLLGASGRAPMAGDLEHPGKLVPLLPDPSVRGLPFVGPHGARGLWNEEGGLSLWAGAGSISRSTFEAGPSSGEKFSPDGRRYCFVDGYGQLWLAAIDSESPRRFGEALRNDGEDSRASHQFYGCGFIHNGAELIAGRRDGAVQFYADELSAEPPLLVKQLREMVPAESLPVDRSPDGLARKALADAEGLASRQRLLAAAALLEAALAQKPSAAFEASLHRDLAVIAIRRGDDETGVAQLKLYQPFARDDERQQVAELIAKFGAKKGSASAAAPEHTASPAASADSAAPLKQVTFHYREAARPIAVGESWTAGLNGNTPANYAASVRFELPTAGVLKLTIACPPSRVAVLVYSAGKKPIAQARACGRTLVAAVPQGEVFVALRALKDSGPVTAQLDSAFLPAAEGAPPSPTTNAAEPSDLEQLMVGLPRSDSTELPASVAPAH